VPSRAKAYARDKMLPEVSRIIEGHSRLRKGKTGPDPDKSILRASVLMLCATWELYCESLLTESVEKILNHCTDPFALPGDMQAQLRAAVHDENVVKSTPLRLAGVGWRKVYTDSVESACGRFNTPKSENLNDLFKKWIGLKMISDCWTCGKSEIDDFVSLRGEIAHRGSDSKAVTKDECNHYRVVIEKCIRECDDKMYEYLRDSKRLDAAPWQKTSKFALNKAFTLHLRSDNGGLAGFPRSTARR
jgi:hypothetical protein